MNRRSRDDIAPQISIRALSASLRIRTALGVGILALMTLKPGLSGSVLIVAKGAVGGLLVAGIDVAPSRRPPRPSCRDVRQRQEPSNCF
jgi:hypothetical protein